MAKLSQSAAKLEKLNQIAEDAAAAGDAVAFLRVALYDEDYLVRSKAFLLTERCFGRELVPELRDILAHGEREWQLRALSALRPSAGEELLDDLRACLFQRQKPLLIRGACLVTAAMAQAKGLGLLAAFFKSPYCAYLKDDFLAAVLAKALDQGETAQLLWRQFTANDPELAAFSAALLTAAAENPLLTVYPYPDYLAAMAKARGVPAAAWKKVTYFPRKKNASEKNRGREAESVGFRGHTCL